MFKVALSRSSFLECVAHLGPLLEVARNAWQRACGEDPTYSSPVATVRQHDVAEFFAAITEDFVSAAVVYCDTTRLVGNQRDVRSLRTALPRTRTLNHRMSPQECETRVADAVWAAGQVGRIFREGVSACREACPLFPWTFSLGAVLRSVDEFVSSCEAVISFSTSVRALYAVSTAQVCCAKQVSLNATVQAVTEHFLEAMVTFEPHLGLVLVTAQVETRRRLRHLQHQVVAALLYVRPTASGIHPVGVGRSRTGYSTCSG